MPLDGAKLICINEFGKRADEINAKGKKFTFGYLADNDYIFKDPRAERKHCEILCDAWDRITITNYSVEYPVSVNGRQVGIKVALTHGSEISILDKLFVWECNNKPISEMADVTPNSKEENKLAGYSCPDLRHYRKINKRLTVHNYAYYIASDDEGNTSSQLDDMSNTTEDSVDNKSTGESFNMPLSHIENTPKTQILNSSTNKTTNSNESHKKIISDCKQSDVLITSFVPRETGVRIEKSFTALYKPIKQKISNNMNATADYERSHDLLDYSVPTASQSFNVKHLGQNSSMHLIDLTTPKKLAPPSPMPKSLLKNYSHKSESGTSVISINSDTSSVTDSGAQLKDPPPLTQLKTPKGATDSLMKRVLLSSAKKTTIAKYAANDRFKRGNLDVMLPSGSRENPKTSTPLHGIRKSFGNISTGGYIAKNNKLLNRSLASTKLLAKAKKTLLSPTNKNRSLQILSAAADSTLNMSNRTLGKRTDQTNRTFTYEGDSNKEKNSAEQNNLVVPIIIVQKDVDENEVTTSTQSEQVKESDEINEICLVDEPAVDENIEVNSSTDVDEQQVQQNGNNLLQAQIDKSSNIPSAVATHEIDIDENEYVANIEAVVGKKNDDQDWEIQSTENLLKEIDDVLHQSYEIRRKRLSAEQSVEDIGDNEGTELTDEEENLYNTQNDSKKNTDDNNVEPEESASKTSNLLAAEEKTALNIVTDVTTTLEGIDALLESPNSTKDLQCANEINMDVDEHEHPKQKSLIVADAEIAQIDEEAYIESTSQEVEIDEENTHNEKMEQRLVLGEDIFKQDESSNGVIIQDTQNSTIDVKEKSSYNNETTIYETENVDGMSESILNTPAEQAETEKTKEVEETTSMEQSSNVSLNVSTDEIMEPLHLSSSDTSLNQINMDEDVEIPETQMPDDHLNISADEPLNLDETINNSNSKDEFQDIFNNDSVNTTLMTEQSTAVEYIEDNDIDKNPTDAIEEELKNIVEDVSEVISDEKDLFDEDESMSNDVMKNNSIVAIPESVLAEVAKISTTAVEISETDSLQEDQTTIEKEVIEPLVEKRTFYQCGEDNGEVDQCENTEFGECLQDEHELTGVSKAAEEEEVEFTEDNDNENIELEASLEDEVESMETSKPAETMPNNLNENGTLPDEVENMGTSKVTQSNSTMLQDTAESEASKTIKAEAEQDEVENMGISKVTESNSNNLQDTAESEASKTIKTEAEQDEVESVETSKVTQSNSNNLQDTAESEESETIKASLQDEVESVETSNNLQELAENEESEKIKASLQDEVENLETSNNLQETTESKVSVTIKSSLQDEVESKETFKTTANISNDLQEGNESNVSDIKEDPSPEEFMEEVAVADPPSQTGNVTSDTSGEEIQLETEHINQKNKENNLSGIDKIKISLEQAENISNNEVVENLISIDEHKKTESVENSKTNMSVTATSLSIVNYDITNSDSKELQQDSTVCEVEDKLELIPNEKVPSLSEEHIDIPEEIKEDAEIVPVKAKRRNVRKVKVDTEEDTAVGANEAPKKRTLRVKKSEQKELPIEESSTAESEKPKGRNARAVKDVAEEQLPKTRGGRQRKKEVSNIETSENQTEKKPSRSTKRKDTEEKVEEAEPEKKDQEDVEKPVPTNRRGRYRKVSVTITEVTTAAESLTESQVEPGKTRAGRTRGQTKVSYNEQEDIEEPVKVKKPAAKRTTKRTVGNNENKESSSTETAKKPTRNTRKRQSTEPVETDSAKKAQTGEIQEIVDEAVVVSNVGKAKRERKPVAAVQEFMENVRARAATPKRVQQLASTSTPQPNKKVDPLPSDISAVMLEESRTTRRRGKTPLALENTNIEEKQPESEKPKRGRRNNTAKALAITQEVVETPVDELKTTRTRRGAGKTTQKAEVVESTEHLVEEKEKQAKPKRGAKRQASEASDNANESTVSSSSNTRGRRNVRFEESAAKVETAVSPLPAKRAMRTRRK